VLAQLREPVVARSELERREAVLVRRARNEMIVWEQIAAADAPAPPGELADCERPYEHPPAGRCYGPTMRWGLSISLSGNLADPGLLADVALAAEETGWDGVFVWDHLWNRTWAPFADPFVTLAAIAMVTERVLIGTMVAALPRRRPQLVAQSTTSLDRLSNGRMVLGLGLGVDSYGEYSLFDEPASDDRARAAALDAGIVLLGQMLTGGPVQGAGGRTTTPAGVQQPRVPIWIAGRAGLTAGPRRVRRHGLEGLALVGPDAWTPGEVSDALTAGDLAAGAIDVALVGGTHPDAEALEAAGATWCFPEILPGATAPEALATAATPPG
jgi:alkanesulfonate monooxygenase SsuD/methylene tetrahydromethanopterin reductase-like flavin-dependent oxidoreductase (luciferase family)